MYVLDTNTLIYYFKAMGNISKKLLAKSPREIGIPAIVIFELQVGIAKSTSPEKRTQQLSSLLSRTTILPFNIDEAIKSAQIRADLEKKGIPIGRYDLLIAGTALAKNNILVTRNTREFERIPGLQLENWYD